jgi:predicted transcriptional regulator
MILNGEKTIEFRTRLPKNMHSGTTIYIYETANKGGSKKVVGECKVDYIIPVLNENKKWPIYGAYPFIDYFFENIKGDKEKAEHYKKLKEEFDKYDKYRYGFILGYAFSEYELESLRKEGTFVDTWKIFDTKLVRKIIDDNDYSNKQIEECDNWLRKIGFYNDFEESYYEYGIVLKDVVKYNVPKELSEFIGTNNEKITRPPQSWMYARKAEV